MCKKKGIVQDFPRQFLSSFKATLSTEKSVGVCSHPSMLFFALFLFFSPAAKAKQPKTVFAIHSFSFATKARFFLALYSYSCEHVDINMPAYLERTRGKEGSLFQRLFGIVQVDSEAPKVLCYRSRRRQSVNNWFSTGLQSFTGSARRLSFSPTLWFSSFRRVCRAWGRNFVPSNPGSLSKLLPVLSSPPSLM